MYFIVSPVGIVDSPLVHESFYEPKEWGGEGEGLEDHKEDEEDGVEEKTKVSIREAECNAALKHICQNIVQL